MIKTRDFPRQPPPNPGGLAFMMTRALSILAAVLLLPACASTWQDQYQGAPKGTHAPTQTVTVREVPWVRVNSALQNLESQRAMSDTHPDEWTSEQRAAEHTTLLTALQISEPPETVTILGRSVFRSTDRLTPTDGSLSDFARSIGADYAVYAVNYLGTKKVAQQEPVHETGFREHRYTDAQGRRRSDYAPYDRTAFVPVVVDADEYAWVVYYLRKN